MENQGTTVTSEPVLNTDGWYPYMKTANTSYDFMNEYIMLVGRF